MEDKVVLVTGSSNGIGEATIIEFAKLGCKVVVHGTNEERIANVAEQCKELSPKNYEPLKARYDLTDETQVKGLMENVIKHYGRLDVLVNNAAYFGRFKLEAEDSYETYKKFANLNVTSIVHLICLARPYLIEAKGSIVNVSSNLHSRVIPETWAYSSTKAALLNLTRGIAVDLAPHVRVNCVSPGPVATSIGGRSAQEYRDFAGKFCLTGRIGEPIEIARVIIYLARPESEFITGSDFVVDGGATICP